MEITSINAHYKHRLSVWDMPEFPGWAGIKDTQLCRDAVDNGTAGCLQCPAPGQVCLLWCQGPWFGLREESTQGGGLGSAGELWSGWSQWLCVTGEGGEVTLLGTVQWPLLCPGAESAAPGSPVQVPIVQDAQMLLVTALGV